MDEESTSVNKCQERCETCRFWDVFDDGEPLEVPMAGASADMLVSVFGNSGTGMVANTKRIGWCRRYPPNRPSETDNATSYEPEANECNGFLITQTDTWCGEWQPHRVPLPTIPA